MFDKKVIRCEKPMSEVVRLITESFHFVRQRKNGLTVYMQLFSFRNKLTELAAMRLSLTDTSSGCIVSYEARPLFLTYVILFLTGTVFVYSLICFLIGKATLLFAVLSFTFLLALCGIVLWQMNDCSERFGRSLQRLLLPEANP